jgi:Flp pilus assembly protein TadB
MSTPPSDDRPDPDDLTEYERADFPRGIPDSSRTMPEGGAGAARSALTLRLVLAVFGLVVCVVGGVVVLAAGAPLWFAVVLFVLAAIALIDLVVVARRKLRGEPG